MVSLLLRFHETQVQQLVHFNTNIDDDLYQQDLMIVWSNKLVQTDLSKYLIVARCRKTHWNVSTGFIIIDTPSRSYRC